MIFCQDFFIEISVTVGSYGLILSDSDPSHDQKMTPFKDQSYFSRLIIPVGVWVMQKENTFFPLLLDM